MSVHVYMAPAIHPRGGTPHKLQNLPAAAEPIGLLATSDVFTKVGSLENGPTSEFTQQLQKDWFYYSLRTHRILKNFKSKNSGHRPQASQ